MNRFPRALCLGLILILAAPVLAAPPKEGTYELAVRPSASGESIAYLVKLEVKDGTVTGNLAASAEMMGDVTLKDVALDGDTLRFTIKTANGPSTFEGRVEKADATEIVGSFGNDARATPARLRLTEKTTIGRQPLSRRLTVPDPMKKALEASSRSVTLQMQARRTQDADEKAKLLEEAKEAAKTAQTELPKLYREVIEKHGDTPAAVDAAMTLMRRAATAKEDPADVRRWAELVAKAAPTYGPRYEVEVATQLAEVLGSKKEFAPVGVDYAEKAAKSLSEKSKYEWQDRILSALATAQRNADRTDAAMATETRLAKIGEELDREYLASMPPFKPEPYAGRKAKSDRVVVMELFTGAQCPPCVAADVAFDALEKSYKPSDLALIQYHLHIPGPDPLTNTGTEARWAYYRERFKEDVGGTPTTVFNGKPKAGGGGGLAQSETKYKEYREIIDELLEEPAKAAVALRASRDGDAITLKADVSNLAEPGSKKKLRFALLEDSVRYAGSNKLRFHHMVVRALPGGPDGMPLPETVSSHSATTTIPDIKGDLTKYLDDFAAKTPFPKRDRPMALKQLKAIAFVQDDETGEILQATIADLHGNAPQR